MHLPPLLVRSRGRTSVARHVYGIASTYSVTVSVSNVLSQHNLSARLEPPITVVEDIDKLRADVVGGRYVVLLHDCDGTVSDHPPSVEAVSPTAYQDNSWSSSPSTARNDDVSGASTIVGVTSPTSVECETSDEVLFEAWVWRGSDVVFVFDFGDGQIERVDAVLNERSMPTAIVAHRYARGGFLSFSLFILSFPFAHTVLSATSPLWRSFIPVTNSRPCEIEIGYYISHSRCQRGGGEREAIRGSSDVCCSRGFRRVYICHRRA